MLACNKDGEILVYDPKTGCMESPAEKYKTDRDYPQTYCIGSKPLIPLKPSYDGWLHLPTYIHYTLSTLTKVGNVWQKTKLRGAINFQRWWNLSSLSQLRLHLTHVGGYSKYHYQLPSFSWGQLSLLYRFTTLHSEGNGR